MAGTLYQIDEMANEYAHFSGSLTRALQKGAFF